MGTPDRMVRFPYRIKGKIDASVVGKPIAIFFGTDFYNLPIGSDHEAYARATNKMLAYMRERLPDHELLYLPHPNEKDELTHLDLTGFTVEPQTIGEVFMYEHPERVRYVFSSCSWASGSAYAMGYPSAVFLDLLTGAIPDDAIQGFKSYFHGFPDDFFITSFNQKIPQGPDAFCMQDTEGERALIDAITPAPQKKVWFLAADPAYGLRAAILARTLREKGIKTGMLQIPHRRWKSVEEEILSVFDEVVAIPTTWYTARPQALMKVWSVFRKLKRLPLTRGDTVVSFIHMQFPENAILSWYPGVKKILITESRWYHFTYVEEGKTLPKENFRASLGVYFFNWVVEPLFGLQQTFFREYRDGKVLNIFRYKKSLEEVYDHSFVLTPPTA